MIREQQAAAFTELYQARHGAVYGIFYSLLHDAELSRELTQDVWLKVWRHMTANGWQECPWPWVQVITRNTFRDYLRSKRTRQDVFERYCQAERTAAAPEPVTADGLTAAWRSLQPQQRTILAMAFGDDELSNTEIGRVLGKGLSAVGAQKCRALQALRQRMEVYDDAA